MSRIAALPLIEWVARCAVMELTQDEATLIKELFADDIALDLPTTSGNFAQWQFFCQRVACRPFYIVARGVPLRAVDWTAELDVVLLVMPSTGPPIVVAVAEVKAKAADLVKAQWQRVRLVNLLTGANGRGSADRFGLPKAAPSDSIAYAALSARSDGYIVPGSFTGFLTDPVRRWFFVVGAERYSAQLVETLPANVKHRFIKEITQTVASYSTRPLQAMLRFHPDYFHWLGVQTPAAGRKPVPPPKRLKQWFQFKETVAAHATELCATLTQWCREELLPRNKKTSNDEARSPLHVVAQLLDHHVICNLIVLSRKNSKNGKAR